MSFYTNITIKISGGMATAEMPTGAVLTSGSVMTYTAGFSVDDSWSGLELHGVFISAPATWPTNPSSKGVIRRSEVLEADSEVLPDGADAVHVIPPECLAVPGRRLYIGLSGTFAGGQVRNSTLAYVGTIQEGADVDGPGDGDVPETRYNTLLDMIGDLSNLDTLGKDSIVGALNEVVAGVNQLAEDHDDLDVEVNQLSAKVASTIGDLSKLETTEHGSVVKAVNEVAVGVNQLSAATEILDRQKSDAIVCEAAGVTIAVTDASDDHLRGLKLYGKTTQDGTPTPDSPVALESAGDSGTINTAVLGKNLFKPFSVGGTNTTYGIVYTNGEDGSVTLNGTATIGYSVLRRPDVAIPAGTYTLSVNKNSEAITVANAVLYCRTSSGVTVGSTLSSKTFATTEPITEFRLWIVEGATFENFTICPQLEAGAVATDYEPYSSAQTLTVQTPNGLPGIPASSGGNYTDADGQQWICDEVDFDKGVYVQRVFKRNSADLETVYTSSATNPNGTVFRLTAKCILPYVLWSNRKQVTKGIASLETNEIRVEANSSREGYSNIYVVLDAADTVAALAQLQAEAFEWYYPNDPIETALTAEELAAYAALHTNKPNTTVYNDAGTGMEFAYNADAKSYVDNKFAELTAAIVSLGGNV